MFGARLRQARQNKKLTQQHMGDLLGISAVGYARYEKETSDPSLSSLKKICKELGVTSDWLLGIESKPKIKTEGDMLRCLIAMKNAGASISDSYLSFYEPEEWSDENAKGSRIKVIGPGEVIYSSSGGPFRYISRGVFAVIASDYLNSTFDTLQILENNVKNKDKPQEYLDNYIESQIEFMKDRPLSEKADPDIAFKIAKRWKEDLWDGVK